jgi:hypothetical protein
VPSGGACQEPCAGLVVHVVRAAEAACPERAAACLFDINVDRNKRCGSGWLVVIVWGLCSIDSDN